MTQIQINVQDLWIMLLSTLRYSMGRQSYMPSYTCDLINQYKNYLSIEQVHQIREELEKELKLYEEMGKTLGDVFDHQMWRKFVEQL
jgi:hypothetical protein